MSLPEHPWRLALLALPAAAALTMSCGPGMVPRHVATPETVSVNGTVIRLDGLATVGAALSRTNTHIPSGRLLSALKHRSLGSDHQPGTLLVNGVATDVTASLHDGDAVVTTPGRDTVEATHTLIEPFGQHLLATLAVAGHPGRARVTRGTVSGEVVRTTVISRPTRGHLTTVRQIALTFDDGPNPAWTPRILAALAQAHVRATFCLIGRQAKQYPHLVKAIVAGGHTLCNHTFDHDEHLPGRSPAVIRQEMVSAQDAITAASGGIAPALYRAPGGAWSPQVEAIAHSLHLTPLKWTVDPRDWARPGPGAIVANTLTRLRPGGIVLLHDGGGTRDQTLAALSFLLVRLPQLHFTYGVPHP